MSALNISQCVESEIECVVDVRANPDTAKPHFAVWIHLKSRGWEWKWHGYSLAYCREKLDGFRGDASGFIDAAIILAVDQTPQADTLWIGEGGAK